MESGWYGGEVLGEHEGTSPTSPAGSSESGGIPRSGVVEANGTVFFVERRGRGRTLVLVHGAGEDAGMLTAQAQALAIGGFQVLTYDRRGTGRSGRDAWPGSGASQHADDAAALIGLLSFAPAVVLGVSSGGIVALKLAGDHPDRVAHAIAWEPPAAGVVPGGPETTARVILPVTAHLADHPHDYIGAQAMLLSFMTGGPVDIDDPDFARVRVNAEPMVRDDPTIALATLGKGLRDRPVTIAIGDEPSDIVCAAAHELARCVGRPLHEVIGHHEIYLTDPTVLVRLVRSVTSCPSS